MNAKRPGRRRRGSRPETVSPWWDSIEMMPEIVVRSTDSRGSLTVVANEETFGHPIGSVAVIFSQKGTTRAQHYHKKDAHLCYVVSGAMEYFERPVGSKDAPAAWIVGEGQTIFTRPRVEHSMVFLMDTVLLVVANQHRTQAEYEKDIVRITENLEASWRLRQEGASASSRR